MFGVLFFAAHCLFSPPADWEIADPKMPTRRSLVGFIEKKKSGFCPSLNLTHEKAAVSPKEYLKIVESLAKAKKQKWIHLGQMETKSGKAELIQIEMGSKYGDLRLFQAILFTKEDVFILTASALKKEFGRLATKMEGAIRSMEVVEDLFSLVKEEKERESLWSAWQKKQEGLESKVFEEMVLKTGAKLGPTWQLLMVQQ